MTFDLNTVISIVLGLISIVLAIEAFIYSARASKESRENYQKTKDVLAEIDKRATVIEKTVADSHQRLMTTLTDLVTKTMIPQKPDMGEQIGLKFFEQFFSNPDAAVSSVNTLAQIEEAVSKLGRLSENMTKSK